jgi:hypothetical protein
MGYYTMKKGFMNMTGARASSSTLTASYTRKPRFGMI